MYAVVCTLVIVLAEGYRDVRHHVQGVELGEAKIKQLMPWKRPTGDVLIVDFSRAVPEVPAPKIREVRANDCLYLEDPVKVVEEQLRLEGLEEQRAAEDRKQWTEITRKLLQKRTKPKK